jgi:hypothetical protein
MSSGWSTTTGYRRRRAAAALAAVALRDDMEQQGVTTANRGERPGAGSHGVSPGARADGRADYHGRVPDAARHPQLAPRHRPDRGDLGSCPAMGRCARRGERKASGAPGWNLNTTNRHRIMLGYRFLRVLGPRDRDRYRDDIAAVRQTLR